MCKYRYAVTLFSMPERDSGSAEDVNEFDDIDDAIDMKNTLQRKFGNDDDFYEVTVKEI